ncbi:hypothetical protein ACFLZV_00600 [Candidatus Margulisiibacteriota bacterium]
MSKKVASFYDKKENTSVKNFAKRRTTNSRFLKTELENKFGSIKVTKVDNHFVRRIKALVNTEMFEIKGIGSGSEIKPQKDHFTIIIFINTFMDKTGKKVIKETYEFSDGKYDTQEPISNTVLKNFEKTLTPVKKDRNS